MLTWNELLAEIRADLQDDRAATPRWSDKVLYIYAKDAIRDYSTWFPLRLDRLELARLGNSFPLPTNFIEEIHVEAPLDTFLEKRSERSGVRYRPNPHAYILSGGRLYAETAEPCLYLTYFAAHPVPASETDSPFALSIPETDIELIRLYVKAKALGQMRSRQAALDRFKATSGKRDDNPLGPEVEDLYGEYLRGIQARIRGGFATLYRTGRLK